MITRAKKILKNTYGFDHFISIQEPIIQNILQRRDTLVVMPTGGGKSICFQIPAIIFKGLTIVVSPLISLMKDQVGQLKELGIPAVLLNSSLSSTEYRKNVDQVRNRKVKLLYVAPETLLKRNILDLLSSIPVECLAIDEAHCISEWGHDFRPEYRQLSHVKSRFEKSICVALTATATPRVQEDIKRNLGIKNGNEYIASFNRKNLFLGIEPKENAWQQTLHFIQRFPNESGIIYCATRKKVDALYHDLEKAGFSVKPYHAGLQDHERLKNQELFIRDDIRIMVATIAFGMGIDKPNVRFVLHHDLPKNIEGYYQEIGRAGRDQVKSFCNLLYSYADIQKINYFIKQKNEQEQRVAGIHLKAMVHFAETDVCRRIPLLNYFGETHSEEKCGMCDNCLAEPKALTDITIPAQKFLSCVKRSGEMFGPTHIIDILRGSESKKIFKFNHQQLSTHGIGKEYSKKQWHQVARLLIHKGYMKQDMEYGGLSLTAKAWEVFRGKKDVFGAIDEDKPETPAPVRQDLEFDASLFQKLRTKRKELADKAGVPPYIIFSDKSLIEMAAFLPKSDQEMLNINGVGRVKLEKYGSDFLEVLKAYSRSCN